MNSNHRPCDKHQWGPSRRSGAHGSSHRPCPHKYGGDPGPDASPREKPWPLALLVAMASPSSSGRGDPNGRRRNALQSHTRRSLAHDRPSTPLPGVAPLEQVWRPAVLRRTTTTAGTSLPRADTADGQHAPQRSSERGCRGTPAYEPADPNGAAGSSLRQR
jgi:hypothetical protein